MNHSTSSQALYEQEPHVLWPEVQAELTNLEDLHDDTGEIEPIVSRLRSLLMDMVEH